MADVFISYASEDRDRVRPLAEALIARGFDVWWDRALAAGQDYTAIIERELRVAKAVVVVWTRGSAASTFVRDEAGRARDEGRLVPVLLDQVEIPLGFGAFQAEDFTRWNGGTNAPQMHLLEEVLKAKLSGRDIDVAAIERRRRRLGARIRIVSLLTVVALVAGIAAFGKYLFNPEPQVQQTDLRAELLRLLAEGKLTPEQAIQLAEILEAGALGETQTAALEETAPAPPPAGAPSVRARSADMAPSVGATLASVSEAEFDAAARTTWREAFQSLSQHPNAQVRTAAAQLSSPTQREQAMQSLWSYARANPNDPQREQIYLLCGAVGERNNDPLGQRALEIAANLEPQQEDVWRMLARSYQRTERPEEANAAAMVGQAVVEQQQGRSDVAERYLQGALSNITAPDLRASVSTRLGEIAESRNDWASATQRYQESYELRERSVQAQPNSPAAAGLAANAQQLIIALDRSGRTREACERLREAQQSHDVAAPDQELLERCQRLLRAPLQPRVELAPQLREQRAITQPPPPQQQPQRTP